MEGRIFVPPIMRLFNKTSARKEYAVINQYFFKNILVLIIIELLF